MPPSSSLGAARSGGASVCAQKSDESLRCGRPRKVARNCFTCAKNDILCCGRPAGGGGNTRRAKQVKSYTCLELRRNNSPPTWPTEQAAREMTRRNRKRARARTRRTSCRGMSANCNDVTFLASCCGQFGVHINCISFRVFAHSLARSLVRSSGKAARKRVALCERIARALYSAHSQNTETGNLIMQSIRALLCGGGSPATTCARKGRLGTSIVTGSSIDDTTCFARRPAPPQERDEARKRAASAPL